MESGFGEEDKRQVRKKREGRSKRFLFKQKTTYEVASCLVGSEMCIGDNCEPVTPEVQSNHIDLLGNLPFSVAAAIRYGNVPLEAYLDEALIDDIVKTALPKVKWRYNPEQDGDWRFEPGRVELRTTDGQTHHALCKTALGHPDNPMSELQRHEKFMRCTAIAARPLSKAQAARVIEAVDGLDQCDDIAALTALVG